MIRVLPGDQRVWLTCISAGRPERVAVMQRAFGPMTWYAPVHQHAAYRSFGAHALAKGSDVHVAIARNQALRDAFAQDLMCIQMDDDFKRMMYHPAHASGAKLENEWVNEGSPDRLSVMLSKLVRELSHGDFYLAGVPPTNNPFFASGLVKRRVFCRSHLWVVKPCGLYLDENLKTKEDYDYTIQHVQRYDGVTRCDWLVVDFDFGRMRGGCQTDRTMESEMESVRYLEAKWGTKIVRRNIRRDGEILLHFPRTRRLVMS